MSVESWKAEFYPIPASKTKKKDAAAHSLRKWEGFLPDNLKKHGLQFIDGRIHNCFRTFVAEINPSCETCALCYHYRDVDLCYHYRDVDLEGYYDDDESESHCSECPLFLIRGGVPCDQARSTLDGHPDTEIASPYHEYKHTGNPNSMILWLKSLVKHAEED